MPSSCAKRWKFRWFVVLAGMLGGVWCLVPTMLNAADDEPTAMLEQLRSLVRERQWQAVMDRCGTTDFNTWSSDVPAAEALHLRAQALAGLKEPRRAESDLLAALKRAPRHELIWVTLADLYQHTLHEPTKALAAYRQLSSITGRHAGWVSAHATISAARLLIDQVKPAEALALLDQYGTPMGTAPVWQVKLLRAYGHAYAAQGNETESLAKFRQALEIEAQIPR